MTAVATLGELTAALVAALDSVGPRVILARTISREDEANLLVSIRERVADGLRSAGSRPAHERGTGVADADR